MNADQLWSLFRMILVELSRLWSEVECSRSSGSQQAVSDLRAKRRLAMSIGSEVLEMWRVKKGGC